MLAYNTERSVPAGDDQGQVPPAPAAGPLPPLERLGDFRIVREIGRGGMGVVFEAEQVSLGRHVALKVLPQKRLLDPQTKQRFEQESRAAARLHHTNIVQVFGVGEHEGLPYYAMQYIEGLGLDQVLSELKQMQHVGQVSNLPLSPRQVTNLPHGEVSAADVARLLATGEFVPADVLDTTVDQAARTPIPVPPAVQAPTPSSVELPGATRRMGEKSFTYWQSVALIGVQVAGALEHAHRQGVLHRDIKPSNLLLDARGTVWVTDFGLAKADDQPNLTQTGDILGTLRYMPPEAFDGNTDARSDVYSLGLTLYELLALRPAFDERDRPRLIKQVTTTEAPRLDILNPAIPRDLATIVGKATEREPGRRYPTAGELAADLQRFLADEPIQARRQTQMERCLRWARRNPGMAALAGVLSAVLVLATVASLLAAGHFNRLRLKESQAAQSERDARHEAEEVADEARRRGDAERWERYRATIAAAAGALQLQNSGAARAALEAAPPEHRNWEWQHLHSQLDGARLVLPVPGGKVYDFVLSPSGEQIALCSFEHNEVYLYDSATGRLAAVLRGHTAPAWSLAYRPDGKQLATTGFDQSVRLWDPATGQALAVLKPKVAFPSLDRSPFVAYNSDGSRIAFYAHGRAGESGTSQLWDAVAGKEIAVLGKTQEGYRPLAFSPDGKRLVASSKEYAHLCDAVTGRRLAVLGPHAKPVAQLAYSPDGKRIASATVDGAYSIHLWDGENGKEVAVLRGHKTYIIWVSFSPGGSRLVTTSRYPDNTARLWDAATGRLLAVLAGHKNEIPQVAFSPDGQRVVTASSDQTARLWDARTGQLQAILGGHTGRVTFVLFNPQGTRVITSSEDATFRLWDARTGELIGVLRGHGDRAYRAPVFTSDGSHLVSGSLDGTVRVWDVSLVERNGILRGHEKFVYDVAFSPDGEQVASAAWDGSARLWDATTGRQTALLKHPTELITSTAYSRDGRQLVTVERGRGITLWDVPSGKAVRTWRAPVGYWAADTRAVLNPAGTLLAAGCFEGPVRLWDVAGGQEIGQLAGHEKCSIDVAFHPDGSLLASAGEDGTVRLWDVATRASLAVLRGHTGSVWRVAFSADGKLLASGGSDRTIRLWDARTGDPIEVIPAGSVVYGLAFSHDGRRLIDGKLTASTRLAAGCVDNTIRLFDIASRRQVAELHGHTGYVHSVAWSPDGTRLVSGSGDGTVRVWDALPASVRTQSPGAYHPPRGYVCYRATGPITIDGKLDDEAWKAAPWTDDFVDIEGNRQLRPRFRTRVKMLWGKCQYVPNRKLRAC